MFLLFCKVRPERLSVVVFPRDANWFASRGKTAIGTSVDTDALQKSGFSRFSFSMMKTRVSFSSDTPRASCPSAP